MEKKINILVVGDNSLFGEIKQAFGALSLDVRFVTGLVDDYRQGVEAAHNHLPDVIFFEIDRDIQKTRTFVQEVHTVSAKSHCVGTFRPQQGEQELPGTFVVEGLRAGIRDFLRRPVSSRDIKELFDRLSQKNYQSDSQVGKVITLMSNKGGVGKSTLSVNIACGLAHRYPGDVLLIDSSIQLGAIAAMLDIEPKTTLLEVVKEKTRLDGSMLRRMVETHDSGLDLLAAPEHAVEATDITDESLARVLNIARSTYKYVIVDTFPMVDSLVVATLDYSDIIFVILEAVVPTIQGTAKLFELLEELGYPVRQQRLVVNRHSNFKGNISPDLIEEKLKREVNYVLPYTRGSLVAMNLGKPLVMVHRNSLTNTKRILHKIIDRLVRSGVMRLPFLLRWSTELKFVFGVESMVEDIVQFAPRDIFSDQSEKKLEDESFGVTTKK